ncbi:MAG: hypothetical protein A2Y67_04320 [Candidatus Buchananbacteria bacterium RBG_13_39_9]|uniref:Transposase IS200-like domain-containing protein n=1 Tax=Candidatus Buchananbacteria bacterium RBG_13_39_9 TaxID=1797531 RepID=A0A1G1XQ76_9BACT|nr:MAG: hypothetical protein A2Y67_04320 [Candidatus Buchananbacteria bacterium RBG_13_39_9]
MRKINFSNNEYYHIYNRGTDKRDIFLDEDDYLRFLLSLKEFNRLEPIGSLYEKNYQNKKAIEQGSNPQLGIGSQADSLLVEIICYCLNPNHYHLILKQLCDNGISKFMHKISLGYTIYFNLKNERSGSLFQGKFKFTQITSFEHLLWLSVYVNTNAQIHGITDNAADYPWCSYPAYLGIKGDDICNKNVILNEFYDYKAIAEDTAKFMKKKKEMEKYLMEDF